MRLQAALQLRPPHLRLRLSRVRPHQTRGNDRRAKGCRLPEYVDESYPASSRASHEDSKNKRCCGSVISASFGVNPKNAASKRHMFSRIALAFTQLGCCNVSRLTPDCRSSSSVKNLTVST